MTSEPPRMLALFQLGGKKETKISHCYWAASERYAPRRKGPCCLPVDCFILSS